MEMLVWELFVILCFAAVWALIWLVWVSWVCVAFVFRLFLCDELVYHLDKSALVGGLGFVFYCFGVLGSCL